MREPLLARGVTPRSDLVRPPATGELRAELIDPLADGRWESFVAAMPGAGVFHHRAWLALLQRTFSFPMSACCIVDGSGAIRAGTPLAFVSGGPRRPRLVSLPLSHTCPPLSAPEDADRLAGRLVHALDDLRRSLGIPVELRGPIVAHPSAHVSARVRTHRIWLDSQPGDSSRGAGRLAIERRTDTGALAELHRVRLGMQRRRGLPTEPRRFVLGLAHLFDRGLGCVLLLRDGRRAVAGATLLCFNDTVVCAHRSADGGAPPEAEDLLILEAIRWGCAAGVRTLDLGPACPASLGARHGAEETAVRYHQLSDTAPRPAPADRAWARPVVRRAPALVSRILGETRCRWAS
jgi:Acetyltransferase (GNAT) domain